MRGVNKLAAAVRVTLGPKGRNVRSRRMRPMRRTLPLGRRARAMALGARPFRSAAALPAVLLVLAGCAEPAGILTPRAAPAPIRRPGEANRPPVADAGPDQRAREGDNVILNGAGSTDPDGTIVSFRWTPRINDEVTLVLEDAETATPSFVVPDLEEDTTFVFDLVVVDDQGASSSDAAEVFVTTYDDM